MAPAKRALIIGCNYPGSEFELRGCVNDCHAIKGMLTEHFGFDDGDITMLLDTDKSTPSPTGKEIKAQLKRIVAQSANGDVLFLHYSGHGTQIKDKKDKGEEDGMDEAICPTDMNIICDDDLRDLLEPLGEDVRFTMIADCCHSGSMLDDPKQQISGDKDPDAPAGVDEADDRELMGSFFKGEKGADDAKNRDLPADMLASALGGKMGGKKVDPDHIKSAMAEQFGSSASKKALKKAGLSGAHADAAGEMLGQLGLGGGEDEEKHGKRGGGGSGGGHGKHGGGGGGGKHGGGGGGGGHESRDVGGGGAAGGGKGKVKALGVLITGCQSHETSADACPSGNPRKAFGALSNALTTMVANVKKRNPDAKLTNHFVVSEVRKTLMKANFEQNPCLECSARGVKESFICA